MMFILLSTSLAAVAFIASMLGIGGGVFYTPLELLFGLDIYRAAANSLFLIFILSISATFVYHRAGKIDWRMACVLETFTVSGSFVGGYFSDCVSQTALTGILVAVITVAGVLMIRGRRRAMRHDREHRGFYIWKRHACGETYELNVLLALPLSFVAGMLSGLVGIGGGAFKVPMMVLLFGIPMDIAIATSAFMVGVTSFGGLVGHIAAGHWDPRTCLLLAPGVFVGAQLGARMMLRTGKKQLRKLLGIVLLVIAAVVVAKAIWG